jgi:hypothetical protein
MKTRLLSLLLLAACATQPTAVDVATAFAAAVGTDATVLAASAPSPAQALTTSQITVTVAGHLGAVRCRDGGWLVQVPQSGATVVSYATSQGTAGAMLNIRGANQTDVHSSWLPVPATISPGDALVVASTGTGRGGYWEAPGRSVVDEMMPVVFVSYPVHAGLLRPPAVGDGFLPRFFRSLPIPESAVRTENLPTVVAISSLPVNWSAWGADEPTTAYLTGLFRPFAGDVYDGWSTDTRTPDHQNVGYYLAPTVSQALVRLCSTDPAASKRELALAIAQRGLDLAGAFADGRRNYPLGGHGQGRKALLIATGVLMGIEPFADPNAFLGPVFQEDGYSTGPWWFPGWNARWAFRSEPPFDGRMLANPPATWGPVVATQHDSWAWMVAGYMPQTVGGQVGTALAMRLMGRTRAMGVAFDGMVSQWMASPPAAADTQLRAVGLALPWNTDFATVRGVGFCAAAWRKHGQP